jgi:hypothetical protein
MREYGQVQSAFWQSPDAEALSDRGKLLACYLMTGPYTNGIGCFRVTDGNVMDDFGWDQVTVVETISELSRIGFAERFGKLIFIPKFLRWNRIANGNVAKARFQEFENLPKGDAKSRVARALLEFCRHWETHHVTVLKTVSDGVAETSSAGYANQNPTQPNPIQKEPNIAQRAARHASPASSASRFEEFWAVYPVKKGRATAQAKWTAKGYDAIADRIIGDVEIRKVKDRQWRDGYIPHGSTYVNGRGWEDEIEVIESGSRDDSNGGKFDAMMEAAI